MKERFLLHLGDAEILTVIVRNGLFGGMWSRMRREMLEEGMIFPGITLHTLDNLQDYEVKYQMNINQILFPQSFFPFKRNIKNHSHVRHHEILHICYSICRGIFSYPCVAEDNRVNLHNPGKMIYRTYLARPLFDKTSTKQFLSYEGVNRMMPNPDQLPKLPRTEHDRLLDQLNKIRECAPCNDQINCLDHQYVMDATQIVISEYGLDNSFIGKILARSLCWMTAEESRLMRLIEKEGVMTDVQGFISPTEEDPDREEFYSHPENENLYAEHNDSANIPTEPNPLLDVVHDLRESIRDTIRLLNQTRERLSKTAH